MELFFEVILSGMAVAYIAETLGAITPVFISSKLVKNISIPPLAFLACWLFNITGFPLIVCGLAAAFFSAALIYILTKSSTVTNVINRR